MKYFTLATFSLFVVAPIVTTVTQLQSSAIAQETPQRLVSKSVLATSISELLLDIKKQKAQAGAWHPKELTAYYKRRGYDALWFDDNGNWKRDPKVFYQALLDADKEGLNPHDYQFAKVANQSVTAKTPNALALHDVQLTNGLLHYVHDLSVGRAQPSEVFPLLFLLPQDRQYDVMLESVMVHREPDAIARAFHALAPRHEDYAKLRSALERYRALQNVTDSWTVISNKGVIHPGQSDSRMPQIRQRMQLLGRLKGQLNIFNDLIKKSKNAIHADLQDEYAALNNADTQKELKAAQANLPDNLKWIYDEVTEKAIRRFQELSGAKVDGVIGPNTIKELNTPMKDRIRQIMLSMERWRWLPESLGDKYVLANIAGFYVEAVDRGRVVVRSPVIVGQVAHQTPAFSSYITNVKFYPDWSVPYSIARRYVLPKITANPAVIDTLGYEIYKGNQKLNWGNVTLSSLKSSDFPPYRFRQKPGPHNALGMVRFSIDNDYSIYMHDTADHSLFDKDNRTFSSGCIRVQKREDMAAFLLDGNSDIDAQVARQKFTPVATDLRSEIHMLDQKIPVHIVYMTAWVDNDGDVKFGNDIYNRDSKLARSLIQQEGEL